MKNLCNHKAKITVYSIWDNRTDELVVFEETAKKCSELLNISKEQFYGRVSSVKLGRSKRWYITSKLVYKEDVQ